ncbi:MAG: thrombospondin type 3 repeat-containing protein [Thermoanaerobaculia bacterium]
MKKGIAIAVVAIFFLVGSTAVFATMENMKAFTEKYPDAKAKLGKCTTCHAKSLPKKGDSELNPYGLDVKSTLGKDKKPDFAKIEQKDSDGDGVKNIDEIKAGTNPGDKNSK